MKLYLNILVSIFLCLFVVLQIHAQQYDIYIQGAIIFDGSGNDSTFHDIGINRDRISYVGPSQENITAKRLIKAEGLYLAPGFIDPHTHYLGQLKHKNKKNRAVLRALAQGVTTVFVGNDGTSPLPISNTMKKWASDGIGPNAAFFVGHNSIRKKVLGNKNVQPNAKELNEMKDIVKQAMEEGAFGLSTGLFYTPGSFAKIDELVALSKVAHTYGGIHDTHQRDEGSQNIGVINSTKEILEIGKRSGINTHFSHIKVAGPNAWGMSTKLISLIEQAQNEGLTVTANQYPYLASRTSLSAALVPAWVRDGGLKAMRERFQSTELRDSILKGIHKSIQARTADPNKLLLSNPKKQYHNKSLRQIADEWKLSPEEAVIQICTEDNPSVHSFMMKEADLLNFMKKPWTMVGSDGGAGHPRAFGTFAKFIEEYALEKKVLSVSTAVHKASYLTAKTLKIKKRGLVKEGYYADIMLFNPHKIRANSNYENGEVLATGIDYVIVNGTLAIDKGKWQNKLSGRPLKRNE